MVRRPALLQPMFCVTGIHQVPPPRDPPGPVVAFCPCCGKAMYCYGIQHSALNIYPNLMLPNFPRVLGPLSMIASA